MLNHEKFSLTQHFDTQKVRYYSIFELPRNRRVVHYAPWGWSIMPHLAKMRGKTDHQGFLSFYQKVKKMVGINWDNYKLHNGSFQ